MILSAPSFLPVVGEGAGARIARIVRFYEGCSLTHRFEELAALVGRGVDDEAVARWTTNCCTFALGVLAAAGVDFPALRIPLVNGAEFGVLVNLGHRFGAWRTAAPSEYPPVGALMWYRIDGSNDDHVEVMLEPPDLHCGGGRPGNLVEIERSNVHVSAGRPLYQWLDPDALQLPDAHVDPIADTIPIPREAVRDTQAPPPQNPDETYEPE